MCQKNDSEGFDMNEEEEGEKGKGEEICSRSKTKDSWEGRLMKQRVTREIEDI